MKITPFKFGLALVIVGVIWVSFIFNETEKEHSSVLLKQSNSFEMNLEFSGKDIGYYTVYMPAFNGEEIFAQVLDTNGDIIQEQRIQTKMSVEYFNFSEFGTYTLKVRNISENPVELQLEFGNTNSQKMIPPGIMILVGAVLILIMSYFKIKNYNIEQPEENIS